MIAIRRHGRPFDVAQDRQAAMAPGYEALLNKGGLTGNHYSSSHVHVSGHPRPETVPLCPGVSGRGFHETSTMKAKRAFTLIELLIVIAIIGILAVIALPNFLAAQTRAKVSSAKADMRTIAVALEEYAVDNNGYPQAALMFPHHRLRPLTTPVRYITSVPSDIFGQRSRWRSRTYNYGAMDLIAASRWILASVGPDLRRSMDPIEFYPGYKPGLFQGLDPDFDYMIYDPTNGVISVGDVIRASDYVRD